MTISLRRTPGLLERVLKLFGKRRAFSISERKEPYLYQVPKPESLIQTLLRPADAPPPAGYYFFDELLDLLAKSEGKLGFDEPTIYNQSSKREV